MDMKEQSDSERFLESQLPKYSSERFYLLSVVSVPASQLWPANNFDLLTRALIT